MPTGNLSYTIPFHSNLACEFLLSEQLTRLHFYSIFSSSGPQDVFCYSHRAGSGSAIRNSFCFSCRTQVLLARMEGR